MCRNASLPRTVVSRWAAFAHTLRAPCTRDGSGFRPEGRADVSRETADERPRAGVRRGALAARRTRLRRRFAGSACIAYAREVVALRLGLTPSPFAAFLVAQGSRTHHGAGCGLDVLHVEQVRDDVAAGRLHDGKRADGRRRPPHALAPPVHRRGSVGPRRSPIGDARVGGEPERSPDTLGRASAP